MKILADRKLLLAAFATVAPVAPARSPKPVLQSIKLTATADGSTLAATDLELFVRRQVAGVKVDQPGSVLLNPQKFGPILSTSNDAELSIETDGDTVVIKGLRSSFKLPSEDVNLFPEMEVPADDETIARLSGEDLRRLARRTMFACDIESTRYALGGCYVERDGDSLAFVATDGRRLAKQSIIPEDASEFTPFVVPLKAVKLVDRSMSEADTVTLSLRGAQLAFFDDGTTLIATRLVEGRFPRVDDIFPKSKEASIPFIVSALKSAVDQASIATSDESRGVDFDFANKTLTLTAKAADVGSGTVEADCSYSGPKLGFTVDPRYILEALRGVDDASEIVVDVIDHKHAVLFRTADGFLYVAMPMTRDQ